jgi:hypothetical protein
MAFSGVFFNRIGHLRTFALACTRTFERLLRLGQETSSPERHHKGARSDVAETRDTAIRLDGRFRIKCGDTIIVVYGSRLRRFVR